MTPTCTKSRTWVKLYAPPPPGWTPWSLCCHIFTITHIYRIHLYTHIHIYMHTYISLSLPFTASLQFKKTLASRWTSSTSFTSCSKRLKPDVGSTAEDAVSLVKHLVDEARFVCVCQVWGKTHSEDFAVLLIRKVLHCWSLQWDAFCRSLGILSRFKLPWKCCTEVVSCKIF